MIPSPAHQTSPPPEWVGSYPSTSHFACSWYLLAYLPMQCTYLYICIYSPYVPLINQLAYLVPAYCL